MKQVKTTYWKVFRIDELFDVVKGKRLTKADMIEGKTNYIGATAFNNGITAKISNSEYLHPAGSITVCYNGSIGQTFYQEEPFWATDDVNVLYPKFMISKYIALFICPIIYKVSLNYAYVDKWTAEKMRSSKIKLPSTQDGSPDWQYMEEYMRKIEQRTKSAISAFVAAKNKPHKIDTTYWKEFELSSIFDIVLSKGDIQAKRMKEGDIPLVSSGKFNNGICAHIADGDGKAEIFDGNVITTDMFGKSYYQSKPFYAVSHGRVNILIPRYKLNQYIAFYLISVLDSSFSSRYSFTGMCSQSQLKQEKILLPATPAGEPDWKYMEMYMRGVEAIAKEKIALLTKKKQEPVQQTSINNYGTVNIYEK